MKLKDLLFEVGGGSGESYELTKEYEKWVDEGFVIDYIFRTLENRYIITFDGTKKYSKYGKTDEPSYSVEVRFSPSDGDVDELTNEGEAIKVINTVVNATKKVSDEYGDVIEQFKLEGITKPGEDIPSTEGTQRARIYEKFYERQFPKARVERKGRTVYVWV